MNTNKKFVMVIFATLFSVTIAWADQDRNFWGDIGSEWSNFTETSPAPFTGNSSGYTTSNTSSNTTSMYQLCDTCASSHMTISPETWRCVNCGGCSSCCGGSGLSLGVGLGGCSSGCACGG